MRKYYLKGVTPRIEVKPLSYHEIAGFRVWVDLNFINENIDKLDVVELYETMDGFMIDPYNDEYYLYWVEKQSFVDAFIVDGPYKLASDNSIHDFSGYCRIYKNKRAAEIAAERKYV